jgi:hypothetical protein
MRVAVPAACQPRLDAGVAALRRNDFANAATILRELAAELPAGAMPWEMLARAEEGMGNRAAAAAALDSRLLLDKRDIGALLLKARLFEQDGDSRAASSFFQAALNQEAFAGGCPTALRPLLEHGRRFIAASGERFAEYLFDAVGPPPTRRIAMALDLLAGRKEVFLQQPSVFYFPELPQRQFFEPAEFPWLEPMLNLLPAMRGEFAAIEAGKEPFSPYVSRDPSRPAPANPLLDDPSWGAFWFWKAGEPVAAGAARCPATMEALEHAPMPRMPGRSPVAHWSRLLPGTHIAPHHGMLNTRLICHIPICTAPACTLRVGSEVREWTDGVPLVFDDSIEHEARNAGDKARTVLLFEIWRPEITEAERAALVTIFAAIGDFAD